MIRFTLRTERLGPLPLINHFIQRTGLEDVLDRYVPSDARCVVPYSRALGVLLRSIIVEREPIYRQQETVQVFASGMFGLTAEEMEHLGDDRLGWALDRLFDADRAALITEVVVTVGQRFKVKFDEFHNDSTSISFCGNYRAASGRKIRGRTAPAITYGFSKGHRPDLKQLLLILTMAADGNVPVAFRCTDGNVSDSRTHIETWNALRTVAGRADFLYVADSKLCSREHMDYIARAGGRFVTVLPRTRLEDQEFRQWIQTHIPAWELVWDRPNPRDRDGPRDRWSVYRGPVVVGGSLADRLGLELLTDVAPGGPTPSQHCRGRRGVRAVARTTGRRQDQTARRRRDRSADQSHSRSPSCRSLSQSQPHRAPAASVQANPARSSRAQYRLSQAHKAALRYRVDDRRSDHCLRPRQ